jgi:serine/threonine protein kinase
MSKKSVFDLDPKQLNQLLSIGKEEVEPVTEEEQSSSSSVEPQAAPTASLNVFMEKPGGQIGRYKLLSVLGEGGMGIVYLAEQKRPIRRQVALKVIKPGMDSKRVIARFEAERQVLALLDHPNIAHVYDAGTTEAGRPYFVMEYVKGLSITEHCDRHKLTIEDRLNLFRQVCHAVHHAHQKGIIHRDIKPSNILVSLQDDQALPKIIDFGVAKALAQPLTERTLVTEQGQLFGTPEYMSPEQADMANEDIDTRSDIYSLGVLLYVLLTGVLPFDSTTFREGGIEHIRQIIRETDPKTPSTRLTSLGEEAKKVAQSRRIEVAALAKCLYKELEWIPLKAMRKERAERYRSASELADDIENYLKSEPLIAGPPSAAYRLKKFLRRHKAVVTGIAAVLAVLVAGVIVSTLFALRAQRQAKTSQAVVEFLTNDVLMSADPWVKGHELTLTEALDVASESLQGKFEDEPLVRASIHHTLGATYRRVGKYNAAEPHAERAYHIRRERFGELHPDTLASLGSLALLHLRQGYYAQAEPLFQKALKGRARIIGEEHLDTVASMYWLGVLYWHQGRYDEAEPLFVKVLELRRRILGEDHSDTLITLYSLAWTYSSQGRYKMAEPLFYRGLQTTNRALGPEHPVTLETMRGLVVMWTEQGRYEEAKPLAIKTLESRRRVLPDEHPDILESVNDLGLLYVKLGRYQEAETLLLEAVEGTRRVFGDEHPNTLGSLNNLIELYEAWGKPEEAAQWRKQLPRKENPDF